MTRDEYERIVKWGVVVLGMTPAAAARRADRISREKDEIAR